MSKQEIINWFKEFMGAPEIDLVDESSDEFARHVCANSTKVYLIPKFQYNLQTPKGVILIEYYQCQVCGKIIMNRNFM